MELVWYIDKPGLVQLTYADTEVTHGDTEVTHADTVVTQDETKLKHASFKIGPRISKLTHTDTS